MIWQIEPRQIAQRTCKTADLLSKLAPRTSTVVGMMRLVRVIPAMPASASMVGEGAAAGAPSAGGPVDTAI
jgi:hypothetical protein